jgi:GAF domain-containing protein
MDASTFGVALRNEQTGRSELRLGIANNQPQPPRALSQRIGLVRYVIEQNRPLLLAKGSLGSQEFLREHKIRPQATDRSRCWLGVPLAIEGQSIGAIIVQSGEREHLYGEGDQKLLVAVASQVAGAIQTAWLKEAADRNARRLETLQRAGEALMKLAERDEQLLWHAALTITTAGYALGFNRAMLFLIEDGGAILRGRMGIGQLTNRAARRAWTHDRRIGRTFDTYLADLRTKAGPTTAVDAAVRDLVLYLPDDQSAFREALDSQQHVIVPEQDAPNRLPELFISCFGQTTYALLPLLVGEKRLGVVVVDNVHNHEPLGDAPLNQLETWLAQVALVYENQRQHHISDQLIDVNHTVFAQIANVPLKETLMRICAAAQGIIGADCVMIYPLMPDMSADAPRYDVAHTGYVGLQADFSPQPKPRPTGVTMHVLRSGELLSVPNVAAASWFDHERQTNQTFFHRENVHAFIAAPIRDVAAESFSGILYLNFRTPQTFGEQDMRLAESFASMAGAAIHTSRLEGDVRESRDARTRELGILRDVLKTALQPTVSREDVAHTLLDAACELLDQPDVVVTLVLVEWEAPTDHAQEPREVRRQYYLRNDHSIGERSGQELYIGITGKAFSTEQDIYVPDVNQPPWLELYRGRRLDDMLGGSQPTRSELDVLIKPEGQQLLGLFNIEAPDVAAFSKEHKAIVKRLAAAAALALDNVRRQENLHNVLKAATAVMAPAELHDTLQALLNEAQEIAPGVSAVTIWYKDPEIEQIVLGPYFGVHYPERMDRRQAHADSAISLVMRSQQPIWSSSVSASERTQGRFVVDEQIESVAALPLAADGEMVGAIFFNYRQPHMFTREERVLFPIIAAVAAASVRDALRLKEQRKGRERLQAALDITDAVGTTLNLDETLGQVMQTLRNQFPAALPCVLTYNPGKRILDFAPASLEFYRIDEANLPLLNIDGGSIACRVARAALRSGKPAFDNVGDVREDRDYITVLESTRSELCLALLSSDESEPNSDKRLLGVLVLESAKLHAFSDDDVKLMQGIGPAISIAIDRAYQSAELRFNASVAAATALVAEMAHDINREIGTIRNEAYLLKQKLPPELRPPIEKIAMSASRLVTYARAPQSTEAETLDLDSWIVQKVEEIAIKRGTGVELRSEVASGGLQVRASLVLLERTLRHLVRNALEAMKGAGRLTVRTRRKDERFVEVLVSNNGPLIPAQIRQRLFVERVSSKVTEHRAAESGRGLLFVRWAVEAMGGSIELLSKPDEEVTFAFTLPIAPHEEPRKSSDGDSKSQ